MAEETQTPASEAAAAAEVVVAPSEVEKPAGKEQAPSVPAPEPEEASEVADEKAEEEVEKKGESEIPQSASFKEESNVVADLEDPEKKALDELKQLIQAALANNEFIKPPPPPPAAPKEEEKPAEKAEEAATEAPKAEEPAAEAPKAEEPAAEAPKAEEPAAEAPAKVEEEGPKAAETKEELPSKSEEPAAVTAAAVTEEKAVVVEERTVEAIEETVVPVAGPAEEVTPAAAEEPAPAGASEEGEKTTTPPQPEEVFIWGVPLLGEEKSDTVLLKFLRARDFKVKDALAMLKDTVIWRKEFGIEGLLGGDLGVPPELEKVVFMSGHDKEGHPVCYNVYGGFQDRELYQKVFADEEKRERFLRWRIQFLERGIRQQLDFSPCGVCTMVQVTDLRNSPGPAKKELRQATNQALALLQDNYPEFVAKQVFINVPWWYLAFNRMISPFLTQRTKSKFVFAGPSKSSETLFKYIAPEQVPVQYGGLSKENDPDFSTSDAVTEATIKPSTKQTVEIPVSENSTLIWELRVLGWDVSYGAEFVPSADDGYTVIVQKSRKFSPSDEPVVRNTFKIGEPGKIVLTVDNSTYKKKKLLYRSKFH